MRIAVDDKVYVNQYDQLAKVVTLLPDIAIIEFKSGERAKVKPEQLEPAKTSIQESDFDSAALEVVEEFRHIYEGDYMDDLIADIFDSLKGKLFKEG